MRFTLLFAIACIISGCRSSRAVSAAVQMQSTGRMSVSEASIDSIVNVSLLQMVGEMTLEDPEISAATDTAGRILTVKARRLDIKVKAAATDSTAVLSHSKDEIRMTDTMVVKSEHSESKKVDAPSGRPIAVVILIGLMLLLAVKMMKK